MRLIILPPEDSIASRSARFHCSNPKTFNGLIPAAAKEVIDKMGNELQDCNSLLRCEIGTPERFRGLDVKVDTSEED